MAAISPDAWRANGQTFEWRGHSIFYRTEGGGSPLLLVHGFPTASWDFYALWPDLAAHHRVLTLDMLGFGFSAKPTNARYSIFDQADLFEDFLAREHVKDYRLLAHDYGVTVAQELLARQRGASAKIRSVCLLNGGLFPETHHALFTQKLLASPLGALVARLSSYRSFAGAMRRIWGSHPPTEPDLRGMWQLVTYNDGVRVMPLLIDYMKERHRNRSRWVSALTDATIPIRLINGLVDPVSGAHMVERYRELVRNADVVELPDVGHYPQVEAPAQVLAALPADWKVPEVLRTP